MKRGQTVDKLLGRRPIPFDFYAYRMSPFLGTVCLSVQSGTNFNSLAFIFYFSSRTILTAVVFKSESSIHRINKN